MASMRDIKRRRESIQNTEQITRAMKLVSTVKLQKSRERAKTAAEYTGILQQTVHSVLARVEKGEHPYNHSGGSGKNAVIVITSNRGLAGGYNNNIVKLITKDSRFSPENTMVFAVGRKGKENLESRHYLISGDYPGLSAAPDYTGCAQMVNEILSRYGNDTVSTVFLAYTSFKNTVVQIPKMVQILPITMQKEPEDQTPMNFEPDESTVLEAVMPKFIQSMVYGALLEALASENGARMTAMDAACSNAEDMMAELKLKYNRARQSAITQELTEIIAGANAIGS